MNSYEHRVGQSLRRVEGWFAANPELVADNPSLGTQVEALKGVVVRLTDHATAQDTHYAQSLLISKDETDKRREVLRHQMAPIAQVGRALQGTVPGIGVLTSLPKANATASELITSAEVLANKAAIYKDVLIEHGLPADFIEQLKQAAAALKASVDGRGLARASRVAATQGVKSELALGRRLVIIIDAVVTGLIRSNPVKLAEWQQLKRVTVKGVAVRRPATIVGTGSNGVQTSSIPVQTSPISVQTSSIPVQTSSTGVAAAPSAGAKAA